MGYIYLNSRLEIPRWANFNSVRFYAKPDRIELVRFHYDKNIFKPKSINYEPNRTDKISYWNPDLTKTEPLKNAGSSFQRDKNQIFKDPTEAQILQI